MDDDQETQRATHIHLDVLGGIAGDMFMAACLDTRPDLAAGVIDAIRAAGLPADWVVAPESAKDGGLTGTKMKIGPRKPATTGQDGGHDHYHYPALLENLDKAPLAEAVRIRAQKILHLIAEAEAQVHGIGIGQVALHEVGALDSIADVVGAAFLIEEMSPCSWSISPLPVGGGFIQSAHGRLPVPAPATQTLLQGFPFIDDGVMGERITPTGAAILRHLEPSLRMPDGIWNAVATGAGFGTRSLPGLANMLRLRCYKSHRPAERNEQIAVIEFMVDDQTPEDLAAGVEALRECPGVLDVLQIPATGKKSRLGHLIQVLTRPDSLEQTTESCFRETTTIGLRQRLENRIVLSRQQRIAPDGLAVKTVKRPDGSRTAKTELDDIRTRATGHNDREQLRRQSESAVLEEDDNGRS
ncbi:LarC family nickel insertion protein [Pelagibius sp. Alg239-R121]|uniref:LarC family nickel insertion protein n=1 Tax=Pelagibius sp. Alg239-R121 TaxID=2993448 RepID=UPI0024A75176|nr:LarC family nickel insertion protein [Pelagibius sp. Alg239-R121]